MVAPSCVTSDERSKEGEAVKVYLEPAFSQVMNETVAWFHEHLR